MPRNQYIASRKQKNKQKQTKKKQKILILTVITNVIPKNDRLFRKSF